MHWHRKNCQSREEFNFRRHECDLIRSQENNLFLGLFRIIYCWRCWMLSPSQRLLTRIFRLFLLSLFASYDLWEIHFSLEIRDSIQGGKKIPKNPLHDGIDDVTQSSGDIFFFIFSLWLRNSINSPTQHATESILEAFLECSITQVIHCKTLLTWLSTTHQLWPLSLTQLANFSCNRRFFTDFFRAKTSNRHSN